MGTLYYIFGNDAKRIRSYTREKVMETLQAALEAEGLTIGAGGLELLKSAKAASDRFKEGKGFVYFVQRRAKVTAQQVVGHDDNKHHSALRYDWQFLIQVSQGTIGGKVTAEQTASADDELMDVVRDAFIEQHNYFRDTLLFKQMQISPGDEARESAATLNPLTLSFYNITRLATDRLLDY